MAVHFKCRLIQILEGLCGVVLLLSCHFGSDGRKPLPTPVSATPTPHYAPMVGTAFVNGELLLLQAPDPTGYAEIKVSSGTLVEILEAKWYYAQFRYGDICCYMYHVHVPNTEIEGWLEQDHLTQNIGEPVPVEYRCLRGRAEPTPSYAPLAGTVYVNVGEEYGAAGTIQRDPRLEIRYVLAHGSRVEIVESFWAHYVANQTFPEILCYMYQVQLPNSSFKLWLPEDVLSTALTSSPRRQCFPDRTPPSILKIVPTIPEGYEIVAPEAAQP